jgi:flagellar hook-length control protein FliK
MPVAFNPPPLPAADATVAASADSSASTNAPAVDAFALVLAKAGGDRGATDGKAVNAASTSSGRLDAHGHRILGDGKSALTDARPGHVRPTTKASQTEGETKQAPAQKLYPEVDPDVLNAVLGVAMAAGTKVDPPPPRKVGGDVVPAREARDRPVPGAGLLDGAPVAPETPAVAMLDAPSPTPGEHPLRQADQGTVMNELLPATANISTATTSVRASEGLAAMATMAESAAGMTSRLNASPGLNGLSDASQPAGTYQMPPVLPTLPQVIDAAVTAPGWKGEFADKLSQVVMLRNERAEFHLNPAELGPVDVQISFASDQAVVLITAAHATTRDALEQALPYLRDMLANHGIALGQASVQDERNPATQGGGSDDASARSSGIVPGAVDATVHTLRLKGMVDVFA